MEMIAWPAIATDVPAQL